MYIVSSRLEKRFNGQIANTAFQISADPVLFAVSINRQNLTHEYIDASGFFSLSVLGQETPLPFIGKFGFRSGRQDDKFAGVSFTVLGSGSPVVLEHSLGYLEAKVVQRIECATHSVFVGNVESAEVIREGTPLTYRYYREMKRGTTPATAPTFLPPALGARSASVKCSKCGYVYMPAAGYPSGGVPAGTPFADIDAGWRCPVCGAGKHSFTSIKEETAMDKYRCTVCGYVYDPAKGDTDGGIAPGTPFEKIPDTWVCPVCGVSKDMFEKV